jgi:hydroxymethylpyrimidine pyrophosphatase-like HAD family hydrolase
MASPRLIAIDMDGTLLGPDAQVSAENLAALNHAEECGVEIAIATGRRHCYAMRALRELARPEHSALISSNGTVIRTIGSELIHRAHMSVETARWLVEHLRPFRSTLVITFDKVRPDGEDDPGALVCEHPDDLNTSISRWMEVNAPYIEHVSPIERSLDTDPPIQMMLCGTVERMREAEAHLLEHPRIAAVEHADEPGIEVALHRTEYAARDLCILDILPAGSSKAAALLHLAELRGIAPAEIVAIGDNWNDVPMFRVAGRAVVMGNAPADLQALAREQGWAIAPPNHQHGVAVTIEGLLQQEAPELVAERR